MHGCMHAIAFERVQPWQDSSTTSALHSWYQSPPPNYTVATTLRLYNLLTSQSYFGDKMRTVAERSSDACDGEWISPRISFSDFVMFDDGISLQKRKTGGSGQNRDGTSGEFEFGMSESVLNLVSGQTVLTADELFLDGKVRLIQRPRSMASECNLLPLAACRDEQDTTPTPPKATEYSLRYPKRFMDFCKPQKLHGQTAWKEVPSSKITTREHCVYSGCNLPISAKTMWPFSRNNSSGEIGTMASPLIAPMKENNSIGESKTTTPPPTTTRRSSSASTTTYTSLSWNNNAAVSSNSAIQTSCCSRPHGTQGKRNPIPAKRESSPCPFPNVNGSICNEFCSPAESLPTISDRNADGTVHLSRASAGVSLVATPYPKLSAPALICLESDDANFLSIGGVMHITIHGKDDVKQSDTAKDKTRNSTVRLGSEKLRGYGNTGTVQRTGSSSPSRTFVRGSPGKGASSRSTPVGGTSDKIVGRNLGRGSVGLDVPGRSHDLRKRGVRIGSNGLGSYSDSVKEATLLQVSVCTFPSMTCGNLSKKGLLSSWTFVSKKSSKASSTA